MLAGEKIYTLDEIFNEVICASQFAHVSEDAIKRELETAYQPYLDGTRDCYQSTYDGGAQYVECLRMGIAPLVYSPSFASDVLWSAFGIVCCLCGEINYSPRNLWASRSRLFARRLFDWSYDGYDRGFGPSCLCRECDVLDARFGDETATKKIFEAILSKGGRDRIQRNIKTWAGLRFDPRDRTASE